MAFNGVEIWTRAGELRCVMQPYGIHWKLALMRQQWIVKVDVFVDAASALAAADEWRRLLEGASDETTSLTPSDDECQSS